MISLRLKLSDGAKYDLILMKFEDFQFQVSFHWIFTTIAAVFCVRHRKKNKNDEKKKSTKILFRIGPNLDVYTLYNWVFDFRPNTPFLRSWIFQLELQSRETTCYVWELKQILNSLHHLSKMPLFLPRIRSCQWNICNIFVERFIWLKFQLGWPFWVSL